jgi:uncharacterized protein YegL
LILQTTELIMITPERPGGELATRELHFFWLLDGSTSMQGAKIQSLNFAVANAISDMRSAAESNPKAKLLVHALRFATDVQWISCSGQASSAPIPPVHASDFEWGDFIKAKGETAMGAALSAVAEELGKLDQKGRYYAPVIVLVTDGLATDNFEQGLARLMANTFGKAAVRLAVAIEDGSSEVDLDRLQDFIGNPSIKPFRAADTNDLAQLISFVSRTGIERSSQSSGGNLPKESSGSEVIDMRT